MSWKKLDSQIVYDNPWITVREDRVQNPGFYRQAAKAVALVTQLTVLVIAGAWAGRALDERMQTTPWLLLVGTSVGAASGFFALTRGFNPPQGNDENPPSNPS